MKISNNSLLSNITEIWSCGESLFRVQTRQGKVFRVTVAQNVYSGDSFKFKAFFEEQVFQLGHQLWGAVAITAPGADSVRECLSNALETINGIQENLRETSA